VTTWTNLVTNPSAETATTGFAAVPGTTGVAACTNPVVTTTAGTHVLRTTWSTASTAAGGGVTYDVPVVAGTVYSFGIDRVVSSIGNRLQVSVEWRTAGSTISTTAGTTTQVTAATPIAFTMLNQTAPATAVIARIKVLSVAGTGYANWSISSTLDVDALHANIGATLNTYFDGDTTGAVWTGAAHASTATLYFLASPTAPTLTQRSTPSPSVEVYFPTLDADADFITIYRVADGLTETVRGALLASVAGDFVVTDYEVPFGIVATYTAQITDSGGATALSLPASTTYAETRVWLSNPLDPTESFTIELQAASFANRRRNPLNTATYVMGIPRPFNQYFGPGALQSVPLEIWSRTQGETDSMQLVGHDGQILIRTPATFDPIPRNLYASVQELTHSHLGVILSGQPVVWTLTVDESQPISPAIIRPLVTWADWTTAFPAASYTWANVLTVWGAGTWTNAKRNGP
jgi:hypothetical protein